MSNLLFSKREGPLKKIRMVLFDWYSQMRKTLLLAIFIFLLSFCTITKINNPGLIIELGQGWAGNTVNTVIFRHHGIVTFSNYQFTAYYKDKENLIVVRRDLRTDDIVTASLVGNYNVYDAHNSISLGIDNNGYIHISYDHHGHELRYQVSENPLDISEWSDPLPMTGIRETKVTYPSFLMNPIDSSLLFLYRYGGPNKGQACMKLFDPDARVWDDHTSCILSGFDQNPWTSNPYFNHPIFDKKGNLHISYVWRTRVKTIDNRRVINNIGIDYAFSNDNGSSWFTINEVPLRTPITQVNSETIWAVPVASNLINQTSMSIDNNGYPHIIYYANDEDKIPQYIHLWYNGKKWNHTIVSNRKVPFILSGRSTLQIPMSRPEIVIDKKNVVYVIFRADFTNDKMAAIALYPPQYEFAEKNIRILWDEPLGFAEPIIDRIRWQNENLLSMFIQYNDQPQSDRNIQEEFQKVYIVDWNLNQLFKNF